jgi:ATP-dependent exoDNAse (exonuclease V) beta subunit
MTRAIDRLILSGSLDPTRSDAGRSPIGWVVEQLGTGLDLDGPATVELGGARVVVRVDRRRKDAETHPADASEQLALFADSGGAAAAVSAFELAPLAAVPEPPAPRVRRLSYTALALFERCSYRFYLERLVGLRPEQRQLRGEHAEGMSAAEIGDAVHHLLEVGDGPSAAAALVALRYPRAVAGDAERVEELALAWQGSALAARLAGLPGARPELPFTFEHDGVLLHGRFDLFWRDGARALVADYKTNRLDGESPEDVVAREYRLQRLVYALAALRAGVDEVEVAFAFLERPEDPVIGSFGREDMPALEAELSAAIAAIDAGEFRPTPHELACADCPALDRICAGPRLGGGPFVDMDGPMVPSAAAS